MKFKVRNSIFKGIDYYINQKNNTNACPNKPPSVVKIDKNNSKIIVIGDIHGDFYSMLHALYQGKVINKKSEWIGGKTIVVQVGDQIDKGGRGFLSVDNTNDDLEELKVIEYMHHLHLEAKKSGGAVYSLIGNHEIMNMLGDFRYATPGHIRGFGGTQTRKELFKPGGPIARKLACNTNGVMMIGSWIFAHGGLLPMHLENMNIESINQLTRDVLLGKKDINNLSNAEEELLFGQTGLFWNRVYSNNLIEDSNRCRTLNQMLQILKIDNGGIVVGHTPYDGIQSNCDNKIWMTDVKLSTAFGNKENHSDRVEILVIENDGKKIYRL